MKVLVYPKCLHYETLVHEGTCKSPREIELPFELWDFSVGMRVDIPEATKLELKKPEGSYHFNLPVLALEYRGLGFADIRGVGRFEDPEMRSIFIEV